MPQNLDIKLKKGEDAEIKKGFPWVYKGQFIENSALTLSEPGSLANIYGHKGDFLGSGYFNHKTTISARIISRKNEKISKDFFVRLFAKAKEKREAKINVPFYRLVHSEADFLPGLIIDRFDKTFVCQVATAGMENLKNLWLPALEEIFAIETLIFRNDFPSRKIEGLKEEKLILRGAIKELYELKENNALYLADLFDGQKTGWFYDQRQNRRMIAEISRGQTMADIYSHSGGFGIIAAKEGAKKVKMIDSSKKALDIAKKAAELNNISKNIINYVHEKAFDAMNNFAKDNVKFDVVVSDPPAFVKTKKDVESGIKGYEKVAKLSAALVEKNGYLFVASCSHHASRKRFNKAVIDGVKAACRDFEVIKETGADIDHPLHQKLQQSEYLKGILLKIL